MVIEGSITQRQAAKLLQVSEATISGWVHQYKRKHNIPVQKQRNLLSKTKKRSH